MRPDPRLPEVFTRTEARAAGLSDRQIDRRVTSGRWQRLRRGVFTLAAGEAAAEDDVRLRLRIGAALRRLPDDVVLSHHTAAQWWGLPVPLGGPGAVRFTRRPDGHASTRYYDGLEVEVASLPAGDVVRHAGMLVTSPARTVADCLRHLPDVDALAIADAAARLRLASAAEVADVLGRCATWPGAEPAARVLPLVDGRRESPLESWSAAALHRAGLTPPTPQVELFDRHGRFVARVDHWWAEGVAGESDGRTKYLLQAAARAGATAEALADVVHAEREREKDVRALGAEVERWGAADVLVPSRLRRLAARLDRARRVAAARGADIGTRLVPHPPAYSPAPPSSALPGPDDGGSAA